MKIKWDYFANANHCMWEIFTFVYSYNLFYKMYQVGVFPHIYVSCFTASFTDRFLLYVASIIFRYASKLLVLPILWRHENYFQTHHKLSAYIILNFSRDHKQ